MPPFFHSTRVIPIQSDDVRRTPRTSSFIPPFHFMEQNVVTSETKTRKRKQHPTQGHSAHKATIGVECCSASHVNHDLYSGGLVPRKITSFPHILSVCEHPPSEDFRSCPCNCSKWKFDSLAKHERVKGPPQLLREQKESDFNDSMTARCFQ